MTNGGAGQGRARVAPKRRFEELIEQLKAARLFAQRGLRSEDHEVIAECYLLMQNEYQIALHYSLKMHLTAQQCSTFDEKSHELECLRQGLRRKLAKQV